MLADNLKPEFYRIKVRPHPIGIAGTGDIHNQYPRSATSSVSSHDEVHSTDEVLCPSSFLSGRRRSPAAVATAPSTPGGRGSSTNGFLRPPSSSGSLLGDLNGRPLFYMPSLSLDVDPLLTFDCAVSSGSSHRTSPIFSAADSSVSPKSQPPDLANIPDVGLLPPPQIKKTTKSKPKKQQPCPRQSNNNALPPSPTNAGGASKAAGKKQLVQRKLSTEIAPGNSSPLSVVSPQPPASESPHTVTAASPQPDAPADLKGDDDEGGFITVTNKKHKKRQQQQMLQQQTRITTQKSQQPRKPYLSRDAVTSTGTPTCVALAPTATSQIRPLSKQAVIQPPASTTTTIADPKQLITTKAILSPAPIVDIPTVPLKLSRQQAHLTNFMLSSWASFAKSVEA